MLFNTTSSFELLFVTKVLRMACEHLKLIGLKPLAEFFEIQHMQLFNKEQKSFKMSDFLLGWGSGTKRLFCRSRCNRYANWISNMLFSVPLLCFLLHSSPSFLSGASHQALTIFILCLSSSSVGILLFWGWRSGSPVFVALFVSLVYLVFSYFRERSSWLAQSWPE